jgi:hypothetical protein
MAIWLCPWLPRACNSGSWSLAPGRSGLAPAQPGLIPNHTITQIQINIVPLHKQDTRVVQLVSALVVKFVPSSEVTGLIPPEVEQTFYPSNLGQIQGAMWHPVIGPCVTLGLVRTVDASIQLASHSILPHHHYTCNGKNAKPVLSHEPAVSWCNDGNVTAESSSSWKVCTF